MKGFVVEGCHPISHPSNPGMDHEGQFYALLFPASWLGWQLLWPLGNPFTPLSCLLRLVILSHRLEVLLLGRVLSGVCCSVTTANASLLVTQYSSLHRYCKIVGKCQGLPIKGLPNEVFFIPYSVHRRGIFLSLFSLMLGLGVMFTADCSSTTYKIKYLKKRCC